MRQNSASQMHLVTMDSQRKLNCYKEIVEGKNQETRALADEQNDLARKA